MMKVINMCCRSKFGRFVMLIVVVGVILITIAGAKKSNDKVIYDRYYISFTGSCPYIVEDIIKYIKDNGLIPEGYYFSQGITALDNSMLCKYNKYNEYLCLVVFESSTYGSRDFYEIKIICYYLLDALEQAFFCTNEGNLYKCLSEAPLDRIYSMYLYYRIDEEFAIFDARERFYNREVPFYPSTLVDFKRALKRVKARLDELTYKGYHKDKELKKLQKKQ